MLFSTITGYNIRLEFKDKVIDVFEIKHATGLEITKDFVTITKRKQKLKFPKSVIQNMEYEAIISNY